MTITLTHDHVGITVGRESLDATIDWYSRNLGFAIERRFDSHGTTFVFLVSGQAKIELVVGASRPHEAPADNILTSMDPERLHHFCVAVEDLDTAVSQLRDNGVSLIGGPMDVAEIGQRIAFITDNLGTIIELTEPGTWAAGRGH
jgi:catechol 2,3-dioxygenase-like lactoylglutathione lyase family enzyme